MKSLMMGLCFRRTGYCRAPQGARGLKLLPQVVMFYRVVVAPRKGRVG